MSNYCPVPHLSQPLDKTLGQDLDIGCKVWRRIWRRGLRKSGGRDTTLKVWNVNTGVCERTLEHGDSVKSLVQLADGRVVSGDGEGTLKVWKKSF